jgi:hypothetical protein
LTDLVTRRIKIPSETGSPNILEYEAGRISATDSKSRKRSQMRSDLDKKLDKACQELLTDPFSTNAAKAGFLFAGLAAGGWSQLFGYRSMVLVCVC